MRSEVFKLNKPARQFAKQKNGALGRPITILKIDYCNIKNKCTNAQH